MRTNNAAMSKRVLHYIGNVNKLEIACYQQQILLDKMQHDIDLIGAAIENPFGGLKKPEEPLAMSTVAKLVCSLIMLAIGAWIGSLLNGSNGALIGAALVLIFLSLIMNFYVVLIATFLCFLAGKIFWNSDTMGFVIGAIGLVISTVYVIYQYQTSGHTYGDKMERYHRAMERYNDEVNIRQQNKARNEKTLPVLQQALEKGWEKLNETENVLDQYYQLNIIYPKYRGLVPVCTIYEYLKSGRCSSLTGPHGAYNLYESECQANTIIGKLDDIIDRLDQISSSQTALAQAIERCNANANSVCQAMERVSNNTAAISYYSKVTANNTEYLRWLTTFA